MLLGLKGAKPEELEEIHIAMCMHQVNLGNYFKNCLLNQFSTQTQLAQQEMFRRENLKIAAIGPFAVGICGLEILRESVEDADHNTTRTLIMGTDYTQGQQR